MDIENRDSKDRNRKTIISMHEAKHSEVKDKNLTAISMHVDGENQSTEMFSKSASAMRANRRYLKPSNNYIERKTISKSQMLQVQDRVVSTSKEFKRSQRRSSILTNLKIASKQSIFYKHVNFQEAKYLEHCSLENYSDAIEVLVVLLNYSVDLNICNMFLSCLKALGQFYLAIGNPLLAISFYRELQCSALLLSEPEHIIISLIGLAECCEKQGLEREAIIFLKKGIEYAWVYEQKEFELKLYDEIGKQFYRLGDIEKAKKFHYRFINSEVELQKSAIRMLSKQRILKLEELNIETKHKDLNVLFLVNLNIPIKSPELLSVLPETMNSVRLIMNFDRTENTENYYELEKVLNSWMFQEEIDENTLQDANGWSEIERKEKKNVKFSFIDFKLNQYLARLSGNATKKLSKTPIVNFKKKESLNQQVLRRQKEPSLKEDWYQILINQINRDHKNKLLNVRSAVRMRGHNRKVKPSFEFLKDIFYGLYAE